MNLTLAQALERRRYGGGRCGFVPFITAGDPSLGATERYVRELTNAGADIIEIGVPFSDPVADGPTIQAAGERSLNNGATLVKIFNLIGRLKDAPPIILFTYLNPVLALGREKFARLCAAKGVTGALIVDLPAEEWASWKTALTAKGVEPVLLASPTTTPARLKSIGKLSGSLVYYVSREGVTGARQGLAPGLSARLRQVRRLTGKPLIVGFGVAQATQAKALAPHCQGVVVGSALVAAAAQGGQRKLGRLARSIVSGLTL